MNRSRLVTVLLALFAMLFVAGLQVQAQPTPTPTPQNDIDKERITALETAVTDLTTRLTTLTNSARQRFSINPPVGTIVAFAGDRIPDNWRLCNGDPVTQADYPELWEVIRNTWGGTGATDFKLPDLRGVFLRGFDFPKPGETRNRLDPEAERRLGSRQLDAMQNHKHNDRGHNHPFTITGSVTVPSSFGELAECGGDRGDCNVNGNEGNQGTITPNLSLSPNIRPSNADITDPVASNAGEPRVGPETRPVNVAVHWIIKVKDEGSPATAANLPTGPVAARGGPPTPSPASNRPPTGPPAPNRPPTRPPASNRRPTRPPEP